MCALVVESVVRREDLFARVINSVALKAGEKRGVLDSLVCNHEEDLYKFSGGGEKSCMI